MSPSIFPHDRSVCAVATPSDVIQREVRALKFLEAMIRYVAEAAEGLSAADLRQSLEQAAPPGVALMTTIAQEWITVGEQRGLQQGLQLGLQQGLRRGLLSGIGLALKLKFGLAGTMLLPEIYAIEDVAVLQAVQDSIEVAAMPEDLRQVYRRQ